MIPQNNGATTETTTPTGELVQEEQAHPTVAGAQLMEEAPTFPTKVPLDWHRYIPQLTWGTWVTLLALGLSLTALVLTLVDINKGQNARKLETAHYLELKRLILNLPKPKDYSGDIDGVRNESNRRIQGLESYIQQILPQELQKLHQMESSVRTLETNANKQLDPALLNSLRDTVAKQERNLTNIVQILRNHDRAMQLIYANQRANENPQDVK